MSKVTKKPKWGKPKLLILTGGKPEETVLLACKNSAGSGMNVNHSACGRYEPSCTNECSVLSPS